MTWKQKLFLIQAAICLCACANKLPVSDNLAINRQLLRNASDSIQSGDIVLRSGKDFTSYRIRELSDKDKTYSHAGIARVTNGQVFIYHITPPDVDEPAADTAMRLETLQQFADPSRCFGFGTVRYPLNNTEIGKALACLDSLYKNKTSFDHFFDLRTTNNMYCSEMVDYTLQQATGGRIQMEKKYFTHVQAIKAAAYFHLSMTEVTQRAYISIDNLELNPYAGRVHDYVYLK